MIAKFYQKRLLCFVFLIFGLIYVLYSSLPILNPNSDLYLNDEGFYLGQRKLLLDLRYGFFSLFISIYFLFIKSPFWVAVIHKSLMLCAFRMLWPSLISQYGLRVFTLLYFSFIFLNGFFLRDSLIFLFCLFALTQKSSKSLLRNVLVKIPIILTRPQSLLLFLSPWLSIAITITFILFFRPWYAQIQINDNGYLTIFNLFFWRDVFSIISISLSNLNPLELFDMWIRDNHINLFILILSSISVFVVFEWMILAFFREQYRNIYWSRLLCGVICLFILYASIGVPIDKRILIASLSPFLIFAQSSLLHLYNIISLIGVWIFMLLAHELIRGLH